MLKIRLLGRFKARWLRAFAWLELHPPDDGWASRLNAIARLDLHGRALAEWVVCVRAHSSFDKQRTSVSRLWAVDGHEILWQYSITHLFRLEFFLVKTIGASLRAEMARQ